MAEVCTNGQLTAADIVNLTTNILGVNSWVEGGPAGSGTMANGRVVPSPMKVITDSKMFKDAIAWTASTLVTDALQTYTDSGIVYAPIPSLLPFTTGLSFTSSNWYVLQGLLESDLGNLSIRSFDTVADMVADLGTIVGDFIKTESYLNPTVGGGAFYQVVAASTGTADGGEFIDLDSGFQAQLIPGKEVTASQYGAVGDGVADDTIQINNLEAAFDRIDLDTNSVISSLTVTGNPRDITISKEIIVASGGVGLNISVDNINLYFSANGKIVGDGSSSQVGIQLSGANSCFISLPNIVDCNTNGIYILNGSSNNTILKGEITGTGGIGGAIHLNGNSCIENSIFETNLSSNTNAIGCRLVGASYNLLNSIKASDCATGIFLEPVSTGTGTGAKYNSIVGAICNSTTSSGGGGIVLGEDSQFNSIEYPVCNLNTGSGIVVTGIVGFEAKNNNIITPVCNSNTINGITATFCDTLNINSPQLHSNTAHGLATIDCSGVNTSGGVSSLNGSDGINHRSVKTKDLGIIVIGNLRHGIAVTTPTTLASVSHLVSNCEISGNVSEQLSITGTALLTTKANNCSGLITENRGVSLAQDTTAITHGLTLPGGYSASDIIIIVTPTNPSHSVSVSAKTSTQFTIRLFDDTGTAVVVNENINWAAYLY